MDESYTDEWLDYDRMNLEIESQEEQACCSGCMDCIGPHWSEFM